MAFSFYCVGRVLGLVVAVVVVSVGQVVFSLRGQKKLRIIKKGVFSYFMAILAKKQGSKTAYNARKLIL